jgi:hypothetical protein
MAIAPPSPSPDVGPDVAPPSDVWGEREAGVRTLFEGSVVIFLWCGLQTIREWVAQCHEANTSLTAQCCIVAGMASPEGLAKQCRDMIPRRCQQAGMVGIRL